jgi:hypothetical protein
MIGILKLAMMALQLPMDSDAEWKHEKQLQAADSLHVLIRLLKEAPPECQTDGEKTAYAFGWWKSLEANRKPWVSLTDEEMLDAIRPMYRSDGIAQNALDLSKDEYRAIEAALKEKNS